MIRKLLKTKKQKTMSLLRDFDSIFNQALSHNTSPNRYRVWDCEDGSKEIFINVIGHNPKNIEVNATEDNIHIYSTTEPKDFKTPFVTIVDISFTVGDEYNGSDVDAEIKNGILTLKLKKDKKKTKKIPIKF